MNFLEQAWAKQGVFLSEIKQLTEEEIENIMERKIIDMELWIENRNSKIYKIKDENCQYFIAKQSKTLTSNEVTKEFMSLKRLSEIDCETLLMPKAIGINSKYNTYVMDLVEGDPIASLVGNKPYTKELLEASKLAGKVIAEIHSEWNVDIEYINNLKQVFQDIDKIPGGFTSSESKVLSQASKILMSKDFPIGQIYRDYDPLNIYFNDDKISLIDPPESFIDSLLFWDLATFLTGLRKAFLRKPLYLLKGNKFILDKCRKVFLNAYIKNVNYKITDIKSFDLIISIIELQRIGELMIFQEKHRRSNRTLSKNGVYNMLAIKLLKREKAKIVSIIRKLVD